MQDHLQDCADLTESAIRLAYAERLQAVFDGLRHKDMTTALQAGTRALVYCVQAEAYSRLGDFASGLVTGIRDPRLLEAIIPHLQTAAESAPEGEPRWSCLCYLGDALSNGGRPDASLPFFEQAANQARAVAEAGGDGSRQARFDLPWITGNWANALGDVGDLDDSRQRHLDSAEAGKKAGRPAIDFIGQQMEALRIDIMQGRAAQALPQVEVRLAKVEAWWKQHLTGKSVPEAPEPETLVRGLLSALDVAMQAHVAQSDWKSALLRIETMLEVKRTLKRPAEDIARDRMNRAVMLGRLGHFGDAKTELEACIHVFRDDPAGSARVESSLAELFYGEGDMAQAITLERRALARREQSPDPADRAASHSNLANYLKRSGTTPALTEAPRHQLAALLYHLVARLGQQLKTSLGNYVIDFRRAHDAGTKLPVPPLAELLADPAFQPLDRWLRQYQVNLAELQAEVDQFLIKARQLAAQAPPNA
jgi:tetratricopeptide (TPR) repeat protein